jgi:methyl-accepting chemotaxis protein
MVETTKDELVDATIAEVRNYKAMFEKCLVAQAVVDSNLRIVAMNEAFCTIVGYPRNRLMGMDFRDFKGKKMLEYLFDEGQGLADALQLKKHVTAHAAWVASNGTHIVNRNIIPFLDEKGAVRNLYIILDEVTELENKIKEAERVQKRSETIVQQNPMPILVTTTKFKVIVTNDAFIALSGMERDKVRGMNVSEFKVLEKSGEGLKQVLEQKKRSVGEVKVEFPAGVKLLLQYGIPILNENNEVTNILIVYNDVTELKTKVNQAVNAQKRAETIVQQNPMPMLVTTAKFKVIVTNDAFIAMSGMERDKVRGMSISEFKVLEKSGDGLKQVLEQRKRSVGEVKVEFPAGVKLLQQYGIPITNENNEVTNILIVYNDITVMRALTKEAQEKADLLGKSAAELEVAMAAAAAGNLTVRVAANPGDPLEKLKKDFNITIEALRAVIKEVDNSVKKLENTIKDTSRSTAEITKATEQVAIASQRSSEAVKKEMNDMESISREITDLSASIEEITATTQNVMTHAVSAAHVGGDAAKLGSVATSKMQNVEKISEQSVNEITKLNEQMREIGKIVKLIADISSQTNLLALNAAIEAARAGEHGRGFAVVAGEVRNLAGESKTATNNIEELISSIQQKSESTAAAIKASDNEIKAGIESVNKTIESLNQIVSEANVVATGITEISKATEDQAEGTTRVGKGAESTSKITRENLKLMEDMAALAEETSASSEEIASASSELESMATRLKKMMEKFKLE